MKKKRNNPFDKVINDRHMISCPYCGNADSFICCTDGNYYCPACHYYFKTIPSTITDVDIPVPSNEANIPDATNASNDSRDED